MATKAATYMRNVGRSIGYSMIKEIKDANPAITAFSQNNAEIMKDTYGAITHLRRTASSITSKVLDSEYGELGKTALNNIKEDLKTGNFYNLERKNADESKAMSGMFDGDFGDEFAGLLDDDMGDLDLDSGESMESMMDLVGKKSSEAVSQTIVRTTEYAVNASTQMSRAMADQSKAIYANLHSGMSTINENLSKMIEFANGPTTTHMENSKTFYETETNLSQERNSILKELLDIQKNMYKQQESSSSNNKITMGNILDENGMPDLEMYIERIKQNVKSMSSGTGELVKELLDSGALATMISSPLEVLTNGIAKVIIPNAIKGAMKSFNKTLAGAFSSAMAKTMNTETTNPFFNLLKNVFGIKDDVKTDIDVSQYNKGAVPFDGITRKSIVEVIPTYLAKIESALTKKSERRFDYNSGKFTNVDKIKDTFGKIEKNAKNTAHMDINNYLNDYLGALNFGDNKQRKAQLDDNIKKILDQSFKTGVLFNPKEKKSAESYGLLGKTAENDLKIIRKMFEALPKEVISGYATNVYEAKDRINTDMKRKEATGDDIITALFNNSLEDIMPSRNTNNENNTTSTSGKGYRGDRTQAQKKNKRNQKKNKKNTKSSSDDSDAAASKDKNGIIFSDDDIDTVADQASLVFATVSKDDDKESFIGSILEGSKISEKTKGFMNRLNDLLHKPSDFLAGIIKKADTSLYEMIFGVEYDENGDKKSVSAAIFDGLKKQFEDFGKWMKKTIYNPIKKWFNEEGTIGNNIKKKVTGVFNKAKDSEFANRMKGEAKAAGGYVKDTVKEAGSTIVEKLNDATGGKSEAGKVLDIIKGVGDVDNAASGLKKVKKTGVIAVSEGEMIIPPDLNPYNIEKRTKNENKAKKSFISSLLDNSIPNFSAGGTVGTEPTDDELADRWLKLFNNNPEQAIRVFQKDPERTAKLFSRYPANKQKEIRKALTKYKAGEVATNVFNTVEDTLKSGVSSILEAANRGRGEESKDKSSDSKKVAKEQQGMLQNAFKQIKEYAPEVSMGAIMGTGVSFLTGAIGGPLVGAAVGGGIALIKHSDVVQKMLFGEVGEDGKRKGNILSKELSNNIEKYAPTIGKGATLGAITSILPFVPGGPIAGIMVGSAVGFASKNERIHESLFGKEGFFGENTDEKIKKALPHMGLGAVAGMIAGPFGMVPNILLGSAAGFATSTDKFKDLMFGKEDKYGERHGGIIESAVKNLFKPIVDFTKETMVSLKDWSEKYIKKPLVDAIDPLKKQFELMFKSIHNHIDKFFEDRLGAPFDKFLKDRIFTPVSNTVKKAMGIALAPIKAVVKAPFSLIGAIGNHYRDKQTRQGNADYMTADERLAYRKQRGTFRSTGIINGIGNKLGFSTKDDRFRNIDEALSGMGGAEAKDLASKLRFTLDKESEIGGPGSDAYKKYDAEVRNNTKLKAKQVDALADKIKDAVKKDGDVTKASKRAHAYIDKLDGLSDEEKNDIRKSVDKYLASIKDQKDRQAEFKGQKGKIIDALKNSATFQEHGITDIKEKDLPKLLRYLETEAEAKTVDDNGDIKNPDKIKAGTLPSLNEEQQKRHDQAMNIWSEINKNISILVHPDSSNIDNVFDHLNSEEYDEVPDRPETIRGRARDTYKDAKFKTQDTIKDLMDSVVGAAKIINKELSSAADKFKNSDIGQSVGDKKREVFGDKNSYWRDAVKSATSDLSDNKNDKSSTDDNKGIGNAAGGLLASARKRLIAVSKGELIIPGFADGGIVGGGEIDDADSTTGKNISLFDRIREKAANIKKKKFKYTFVNGKPVRLRETEDGRYIVDKSDSETVETMNEQEKEKEERKSMMSKITDIPKNVFDGIKKAFHGNDEDEEGKKKGILGKIFSIFGGGKDNKKGLIFKGIAGAISIPLIAGFFNDTILPIISPFLDDFKPAIESIGTKITDWFMGEGASEGKGFPHLLEAGISHWASGFSFIMTNVLPKAVEILVKSLPSILLGAMKGFGAIITENFHNVFAAGRPSTKVDKAIDKDIKNGSTIKIEGIGSSKTSSEMQFAGKSISTDWTKSLEQYKAGEISLNDLMSGIDTSGLVVSSVEDQVLKEEEAKKEDENKDTSAPAKTKEDIANEISTRIEKTNKEYKDKLKKGEVKDYRESSSYQELSDPIKEKVDKQIADLTKDNKNVITVHDKEGKPVNMTIQELLMSDIPLATVTNEDGSTEQLTGKHILRNPTLAQGLGDASLSLDLTEEEQQKNKEEKGWAQEDSLRTLGISQIIKHGLTGTSGGEGLTKLGKKLYKFPVVGKLPGLALQGIGKLSGVAGNIGHAVLPGWMTKTKIVDEATEKSGGLFSKIAGRFKGSGDKVNILNSATGEASTRADAIARGLSEEAGDFVTEKEGVFSKLGSKLGLKKAGTEAAENGAGDLAQAVAKTATEENKGIIKRAIDFSKKKLDQLFKNSTILSKLKEALKLSGKEATDEAVKKFASELREKISAKLVPLIGKKLGESSAKMLTKVATTLATAGVAKIAMVVGAFLSGWSNANSIIGVVDEVSKPSGMTRFLCALVSALNEAVCWGLLPLGMLFDFLLPTVKVVFKVDTSKIEEDREKSAELVKEYSDEHGVNLTVEEYNKKDRITTKLWNGAKEVGGNIKDFVMGNEETGEKSLVGKAKDLGSTALNGIKSGAGWVADKASGLVEGAKNIGGNIVDGVKGVAGGVVDFGKSVGGVVSNAFKYATYANDKSASEMAKDEKDKDNPLSGFNKVFGGIMDTTFGPLRMINTIGRGVAKVGKTIMDFGSKFVKQIKIDAAQGEKDFNKGDFENYWRTTETEVDGEGNEFHNPLSPFRSFIKTTTRVVQAPILAVKHVGKQIAKGVSTVISGAKTVFGKIGTASKDTINIALKGSFRDYFNINSLSEGKGDNPLAWLDVATTIGSRVLLAPISAIIGTGRIIGDKVKSIINGAKTVFGKIGNAGSDTLNIALHGSLGDYFSINSSDGEPLGWLDKTISIVTRVLLAPIAGLIGAGRSIGNGISSIAGGAKSIFGTIGNAAKDAIDIAKSGSISDYFKISEDDGNTPFGWLNTGIIGVTRFALAPVSAITAVGSKIGDFASSLLKSGKSMLTNLNKDRKYVSSYMDKDNLDKYWSQPNSKSKGLFGAIEKISGVIDRIFRFPIILMQQIVERISDAINKPAKWLKDKLGKAGDAIADFFGMGDDKKYDKNGTSKSTGKTSKLGDETGGYGTGLTDTLNARGSNETPKSDPKFADDPTFVSQLDSKYANKRFNVNGDSEKQTIADTGCGPAAAAMVVNDAYNGSKLDMDRASKDALRYKVRNGGVSAAYFENEFRKNGLSTDYIMDEDPKSKNEQIASNLRKGNKVVLMGNDPSNNSKLNSPYGPNDHYIVATRMSKDGKYVWVNDPESKVPEVKYPASTILSKSKLGIAGIAASGSKLLGAGRSALRAIREFSGRGTLPGADNSEKVWNFLKSSGFSDESAAGIMGNLQQESGMEPGTAQTGGPAYGICQWESNRQQAMKDYCASKGAPDSDLQCQLEFMISELEECFSAYSGKSKYVYPNGEWAFWPEKITVAEYKTLKDIAKAVEIFERVFERASKPMMDKRITYAQEFYNKFSGNYTKVDGTSSSGVDDSSDSSAINTVMDTLNVFSELAADYGLVAKSNTKSGGDSSSGSSGKTTGGTKEQNALVDKMKSIEKTLDYAQNNPAFPGPRDAAGGISSDCSETVQWAYKNVLGVDPGDWTGAMETDDDTYTVTTSFDESKMQPGDEILYDGHVEMYAGDGQMIGHGGPPGVLGPTLKPLSDQGRFRMIRRWNGFKDAAGSGSGLLGSKLYSGRGTALNPDDIVKVSDTVRTSIKNTDNRGFLKKSRYSKRLNKDVEIPAGMYAAGTELDNTNLTFKAPGKNTDTVIKNPDNKQVATSSNGIGDKVTAYLNAILKLLSKEVENTSMLSTIVTILTELVKISEEERSIDKSSPDIKQKQTALETRRMAMLNVLKSTGINSNAGDEISKLVADAERLARI